MKPLYWLLRRVENLSARPEKTSRSKGENKQQIQPLMQSLVPGYRVSIPGLGTQWWEAPLLLPTLTRARKTHFLIGLLLGQSEGFLNSEMAYWLCGRQFDPAHTPVRVEENALHLLHSSANAWSGNC